MSEISRIRILVLGLRSPNPSELFLVDMLTTGQGSVFGSNPQTPECGSNGLSAKVSVEVAHCITGIHLIPINFCQVINYLTGKMLWELIRSALTVLQEGHCGAEKMTDM